MEEELTIEEQQKRLFEDLYNDKDFRRLIVDCD